MTNLLIVEDEKQASDYLINMLNEYDYIKILDVISSVEKLIDWFNTNKFPDLILMDVQLTDGISFELFEKIKIKSPIVFITSFDEYAIKAIKLSSLDYLVKPISKLDLSQVLVKFYANQLRVFKDVNSNTLLQLSNNKKERFLVKEGNQFLPIKIEEIAYAYWSEYGFIRKFDGKSYLVNYSISQIEEMLPTELFIRINRQILANINSIESLNKETSNYSIGLLPKFNSKIKLSKDSYMNLRRLLS